MRRSVRHVGSRAFVLDDGVWIDTVFNPDTMRTEQIALGSQAYFDLLAAQPRWGEYMSLGDRVIFVVDTGTERTAYEITEEQGSEAVRVSPKVTSEVPRRTGELPQPSDATATPTEGSEVPSSPSGGLCPGAMAAVVVALAALLVRAR
jgi:hypothetical protein